MTSKGFNKWFNKQFKAETPEQTEKRLRKNEAARRSRAKRREAEAAMTPDERLDRSLMKKGLTREEIDEKKRRMNEVIKRGNK